jgi:hypothetical protein
MRFPALAGTAFCATASALIATRAENRRLTTELFLLAKQDAKLRRLEAARPPRGRREWGHDAISDLDIHRSDELAEVMREAHALQQRLVGDIAAS